MKTRGSLHCTSTVVLCSVLSLLIFMLIATLNCLCSQMKKHGGGPC